MPQVNGILETALYVKDVPNAAAFYRNLFGFSTLLETERLIALEVAGQNVLLLFQQGATNEPFATPGGIIPGHGGAGPNHFAFSIAAHDVVPWRQHLESNGVPIESEVTWPGGAHSLYFRDPDNNLVELITPGFWQFTTKSNGTD
jgi:catechol 2,3-dioxygenase-like lactoylglutathione lyase family enzyme